MWLTGFDVPCLHTMYIDKPMRGHGLMQAIARVNRVYKDKPGGLIVDYIGLAEQLKQALSNYTESGGKGQTAIDQNEAVALMMAKYEVCCDLFYGFNRDLWITGNAHSSLTARFFIILTDRELQLEKKLLAQQNLLGMLRDKLEDY